MVKLGHFQYIQDGSGTSGLGIHTAHDDFGDPGLHDGTGAHLAGLKCHIEGTLFQTPVTDDLAGFVDRCDLRMRQRIFICIAAVVTPADDLSLVYDDTTDGNFSQSVGFFACFRASFIYFSSTLLMTAMICVAFPALSLSYFNLFWKTFSKNSRHIS